MPNRVIREGFLDSDKVNSVSEPSQNFYVRLFLVADDFGRFDARPEFLKSKCYPMSDKRLTDVSKMLTELKTASLILLYSVDGKPYLQINQFNQRLRTMRSKYPEPQAADICQTDDGLKRNETNPKGKEEKKEKARTHAFSDSPYFDITVLIQHLPEWSRAKIEHYHAAATDYSAQKGAKYLDWLAAIRNWARRDEQEGKGFKEAKRLRTIEEIAEAEGVRL